LAYFRAVLAEAAGHPSHRYYVLRSIAIRNLYGVDLMEEAVETCKLRLFLQLVAALSDLRDVEPLPDLDFNVRPGNSLVGFGSFDEVRDAVLGRHQGRFDFGGQLDDIEASARSVDDSFAEFQRVQSDSGDHGDAKARLGAALDGLRWRLDTYLARERGVPDREVASWRRRHQPFHWFIEFHSIMVDGGFDVVVGNPPYIAAAKVRQSYQYSGFDTDSCPDVYAPIVERAGRLLCPTGWSSMIVPISLTFSGDLDPLRKVLRELYARSWYSSYARIPSALFSADVRVRNTIHVGTRSGPAEPGRTTRTHRWFAEARPALFPCVTYAKFSPATWNGLIPKCDLQALVDAFEHLAATHTRRLAAVVSEHPTPHRLVFKKTAYNWLAFSPDEPPCYDAAGLPIPQTKVGSVYFRDALSRDAAFLLLNGKLMFAYWCLIGDDFDVTRWMFETLPIDVSRFADNPDVIAAFSGELEHAMLANIAFKLNAGKQVGSYNLARCRAVTDRSDAWIAERLGLEKLNPEIELLYSQMIRTGFEEDE
jgi:hypothetical protein